MMKTCLKLALAVSVIAVASVSYAQTTYRCKAPSGGTVFSDAPCPGGSRQISVTSGSAADYSGQVADVRVQRSSDAVLLDAKVAEAIGSGDFTRARALAVTQQHWQMISDAEQRKGTPVTGRTSADLRAEARNSNECKDAERSYDIEASSIRHDGAQIGAAKRRMYSACGMDEPTSINVDNRTTIRNTTVDGSNVTTR